MKVLVTGGAGYIGSVLTRRLLEQGYDVIVLDRLFFGRESLKEVENNSHLKIIKDDIRYFDGSILNNVDVVMDFAALSNDPTGELDPEKTLDINYRGRVRVATLAKKHGVKRYILASSCSIYGFQEGILTESSKENPLTTYANANFMAERETLALADDNFTVTILRQATVYGLSPRMRFDLAINGMVLGFFKNGKIPIMRDGTQWRPFVHVKDTSKAFIMTMEAERNIVQSQIFNVGSNDQNVQILPLAELVAKALNIEFKYEWYGSPDHRSYRICFDKIMNTLKYKPDHTIADGAKEVYMALKEGKVKDDIKTITVQWYKYLIESQKILNEVLYEGKIL